MTTTTTVTVTGGVPSRRPGVVTDVVVTVVAVVVVVLAAVVVVDVSKDLVRLAHEDEAFGGSPVLVRMRRQRRPPERGADLVPRGLARYVEHATRGGRITRGGRARGSRCAAAGWQVLATVALIAALRLAPPGLNSVWACFFLFNGIRFFNVVRFHFFTGPLVAKNAR